MVLRIATVDEFIEALRIRFKKQNDQTSSSKFAKFETEFRRFCEEQEVQRRIDFKYLFDLFIEDYSAIHALTRNVTANQQAVEDQKLIEILQSKGIKLVGRKLVRGPKVTRYLLDRMHQKIYGYERKAKNRAEEKKVLSRENQILNAKLKTNGLPQIERFGKGISRSQYSRWNLLHWMIFGYATTSGSSFKQCEGERFMSRKKATSTLARWLLHLGLENTGSGRNPKTSQENAVFDAKVKRLAETLSKVYKRGNVRDLPGFPRGYVFSSRSFKDQAALLTAQK